MRFIDSLKDGDRVSEVYLCKSKTIALTKAGREYCNVILQDSTGQIDSKIWDLTSGGIGDFDVNDYVAVSGQVISYNGALQFKIDRIRIADTNEYTVSDYVPCSRFGIDEMYNELMGYVESVKNTYIHQLLIKFFKEDEEFINKFKNVSAAKTVHHGFAGGLLEHSLSVTRMCSHMADNYTFLNRDLLIACAMLHDAGKTKELSEFPQNDYTDDGNFIGHIVMGYEMVMDKIKTIDGFPSVLASEIGHCILSHHGELEFSSPKKPSIVEALALSLADNMDAKMETMREILDKKDTNDWLGYNRWLDSNVRKTGEI